MPLVGKLGDGVVHVDDTISVSRVVGIHTHAENSQNGFFGGADQDEFRWFVGGHYFYFLSL